MKPRRSIRPASVLLAMGLAVFPARAQDRGLTALVEKTAAAMKAENWQKALDASSQAVDRYGKGDPLRTYGAQFGAVYYRKGVCEMKLKRWQEAMQSFEICYRNFPNQGTGRTNPFQKMALLKWGEAAMGAGNWELAVSRFAKFTDERDKVRDNFPRGSFHINMAVCQYKLGRLPAGSENLEIAIRNKKSFPTPESGIVAGFQALVEAAILKHDEQALLDFIGKNRGELIIEPVEMSSYSGVFFKLAGDAFAAGMQRAAIAIYQFVPSTEVGPPEIVRLAAIALIHEKNGNVRGAFSAYQQLELYFPESADREEYLYQLVRTATLVNEADLARLYAGRLLRDFPQSTRLAEIRESGMEFPQIEAAAPASAEAEPVPAGKPLPTGPLFTAAINLYQGRKYQEARAAFAEIAKRYKAEREFFTPAAFYEMECLRKLGDLDGLAKALGTFAKDPSLGGNRLRQLEINALWDAVRTKSWDKLDQLAKARLHERLPGDQRVQVAFCQGMASESLGRSLEALAAYNIAMTADAGASEEIARQAALGVLRIHLADAEVKAALTGNGAPDANRESPGFFRLKEAAAVAFLFELTLGAGTPLPAEFKEFLKHRGST
ncbi:MAG: tetratricopeptide repeat protein [Verrucomicrobiota bacterium]